MLPLPRPLPALMYWAVDLGLIYLQHMWDSSRRNASISVSRRRRNQTEEEDEDESFDCRRLARVYIMMIVISHCTHTHTQKYPKSLPHFVVTLSLERISMSIWMSWQQPEASFVLERDSNWQHVHTYHTGNALVLAPTSRAIGLWVGLHSSGLAWDTANTTHTQNILTHTDSRQDKARHFG